MDAYINADNVIIWFIGVMVALAVTWAKDISKERRKHAKRVVKR